MDWLNSRQNVWYIQCSLNRFQISQLVSSLFKFNFKASQNTFCAQFLMDFQNSCAEKCISDDNPDT